jgi:F-type H+-transporting ATPase subunit b
VNITVTLFGQVLTFFVLFLFIQKFLWVPVTKMMADRSKRIADGLAAAERGKHELELAEQRAAERLREAKQNMADIIAQANKRADEIIEEAKEQARLEGQRQLEAAKADIDQEAYRAREHLREDVVKLAIACAEKVMAREINADTHQAFLQTMIKEL